jgi:membrane protease YdiL (CAAX protease family)
MSSVANETGGATGWSADLKAYARTPVMLAAAAGVMALFVALLPPVLRWETSDVSRWPPFSAFSADLGVYLWRFLLAFVLLGLCPLVVGWLLGYGPRSLGLRAWNRAALPPAWLALLLLVALLIGFCGAFDPSIAAYYPYARSLPTLIHAHGAGALALHAVMYFVLYYLPWEFFFRGFLLRPIVDLLDADALDRVTPATFALASVQVIPSALLHVGHPLSETMGAIPFGLAMGFLALRTRSFVPGLLIHAVIGLATDMTLLLRSIGGHH